jgi:hypothetical protein
MTYKIETKMIYMMKIGYRPIINYIYSLKLTAKGNCSLKNTTDRTIIMNTPNSFTQQIRYGKNS